MVGVDGCGAFDRLFIGVVGGDPEGVAVDRIAKASVLASL
jgi:hypothetical protein